MKVILLDELRGKGGEGDIVDVAQGFAENYLFPNKIAQPATPGNIKQLEERRHVIAKREEKRIADAKALQEQLDGKTVTVDAKIGEEGQLFGSVTSAQIVEAIKNELDLDIDRKRITRGATIKTVGNHPVEINLYRDINAKITVSVGTPEQQAAARGENLDEAAEDEEAPVEEAVESDGEATEAASEEAAEK